MKTEQFYEILDRLEVEYLRVRHVEINEPIFIHEYLDHSDTLILANDESVGYGIRRPHLEKGNVLYIPSGYKVPLRLGSGKRVQIEQASRTVFKERYFSKSTPQTKKQNFTIVSVDVKMFSFHLFNALSIPAFVIDANPVVSRIIKELFKEKIHQLDGYKSILDNLCQRLVLEVLRHIHHQNLFLDKFEDHTLQIKDRRLLNVMNYIHNNLDGNLSNAALADVTNVSEEYFGQMFKKMMSESAQQFVEERRMQKAVELLRETNLTVGEIAKQVGYTDTPYFCRRFKKRFTVSATEFKKSEADNFML